MKRVVCLALVLLLYVSLCSITALAADGTASLTGPGTVRAGDTITVSFIVDGKGITGAEGCIEYDSSQMTLVSTKQKIGSAWVVEFKGDKFAAYDNEQTAPINSTKELFTVTFKVKNLPAGTTIKVSCTNVIVTDRENGDELGTRNYTATISEPLSTDNTLKRLTVSNAAISPAFDANTTSYTAEVPPEVSMLDITAVPADNAEVSIDHPILTPNSTTNVKITVTAEDGSQKTYTIAVRRAQDPNYVPSANNDLSGITADGFLLSPAFSADNTRYVIWLPYETESITVSGSAADSKASVSVEGGDHLTAGADNEIKVICTAENGEKKAYIIIARRAAAHDGSTEPTAPAPAGPPKTQPTLGQTEPSDVGTTVTRPTNVPTEPGASQSRNDNGSVPWWLLILAVAAGLSAGILLGMVIEQKKKK